MIQKIVKPVLDEPLADDATGGRLISMVNKLVFSRLVGTGFELLYSEVRPSTLSSVLFSVPPKSDTDFVV